MWAVWISHRLKEQEKNAIEKPIININNNNNITSKVSHLNTNNNSITDNNNNNNNNNNNKTIETIFSKNNIISEASWSEDTSNKDLEVQQHQ